MSHDNDNKLRTFEELRTISIPDFVDPSSDEPPVTPGYRNYRIYSDESGIHNARYFGFGALFMPDERRGEFLKRVDALRALHGYRGEIKWTNISARYVPFFEALVREFFQRNWLMFHAIVVRKAYVDRERHADFEEARMKFFALLIKKKVEYFSDGCTDKAYHLIVDPLPWRYKKAEEAEHKIINNMLRRDLGIGEDLVKTMVARDSKKVPGIQLADLLLGATLAELQGEVAGGPKKLISRYVAMHLGWPNMLADTLPHEAKFNIWSFHDPSSGVGRERRARSVELIIPSKVFRRTRS